jgi:hypothetical protein
MLPFRSSDPRLKSKPAQTLAAAFRREVDAQSLSTGLFERGIEGSDLAWLVSFAVEAITDDWTAGAGRLATVFLARTDRPTSLLHPEWDPESALALTEAAGGLTSLPDHLRARLLLLFIDAAEALPGGNRQIASEPAGRLLSLVLTSGSDSLDTQPTAEDLLALSALGGAGVDEAQLTRTGDDWADQTFSTMELRTIAGLPFELRLNLSAFNRIVSDDEEPDRRRRAASGRLLAVDPAYARVAREMLEAFDARLNDLDSGRWDYFPDQFVKGHDLISLSRAFGVATFEDAPWFGNTVGRLLPRLVVAPDSSKTVPSQSLAHAFARSVAEHPSRKSLEALAEAARVVRHAGLQKKLERAMRQARKGSATSGAGARAAP